MADRETNGESPNLGENRAESARVTPTDLLIARFQKWLDDLETKLENADKRPSAPPDVPRFYTRNQ